jgi:hypothetical protein
MNKIICIALSNLLFALCSTVQAQQATKVYRVGVLSAGPGWGVSEKMLQRDMRERGFRLQLLFEVI